jgi:hypothetical protein
VLDEKALRRPDFKPGVPVVLGDGQTWDLRKPRLRFIPVEKDGAVKSAGRSCELGPECDELVGIFFGDIETASIDFASARFDLTKRLLTANYLLSIEQLQDLVYVEPENKANEEMWTAISTVIAGRTPKPTPAT